MPQIHFEEYQIYILILAIAIAAILLCYLVFQDITSQPQKRAIAKLEKMILCMHEKWENTEKKIDVLRNTQNAVVPEVSRSRMSAGCFRPGDVRNFFRYDIKRLEDAMFTIREEQKYLLQLLSRSH